jgi:hypothetical protein
MGPDYTNRAQGLTTKSELSIRQACFVGRSEKERRSMPNQNLIGGNAEAARDAIGPWPPDRP